MLAYSQLRSLSLIRERKHLLIARFLLTTAGYARLITVHGAINYLETDPGVGFQVVGGAYFLY